MPPGAGSRGPSPAAPAPDATWSIPTRSRRLLWVWPPAALLTLAAAFWHSGSSGLAGIGSLAPAWLAAAVAMTFLPWFLNAWRLRNWLRWRRRHDSYGCCLRVVLAGELGAALTPSALGGGAVKVGLLASRGVRPGEGAALTVVGTAEDAAAVSILLAGGLGLAGGMAWLAVHGEALDGIVADAHARLIPAAVGLAVAAAAATALVRSSARRRLAALREAWLDARDFVGHAGRRGWGVFGVNVALAIVQWGVRLLVFPVVALGLGLEVHPVRLAVLQWLSFALMGAVPTPGAIGGAEAVFMALHAPVLPAASLAPALAAWRLLTFYVLNGVALAVLVQAGRRGVRAGGA